MHPLLDALRERPARGLDELRGALRDSRGPLVRRVAGSRRVSVTFVWIDGDVDDAPSAQVSLQCGLARHNGLPIAMHHLDGTPVWWFEVDTTADALVSYRYVVDDPFAGFEGGDDRTWMRLMIEAQARSFADPHNQLRIAPLAALFGLHVPPHHYETILRLDDAPSLEPFQPHDAPTGPIERLLLVSPLGDRTVEIWTPHPALVDGPLPIVVLLDGSAYVHLAGMPRALDGAVHRGVLRPCLVAFVGPSDEPDGFARRTEELTCNPAYADLLATSLLPMLRARPDTDASALTTVLGGASLGGLTSTYTALAHPGCAHNVLSISGSYWYGWERDGEPEWLTRHLAAHTMGPPSDGLRIVQQIGTLEDSPLAASPGVCHLVANRHFRDVALARGLDLHYVETTTAHDLVTFAVTTLDGLVHLLPGGTR